MLNKEIKAGMLAINLRIDNLQSDVTVLLRLMQEVKDKLAEQPKEVPTDSPFLTKEGLYNYKHRKTVPKEE
jgi:hypothetical protein